MGRSHRLWLVVLLCFTNQIDSLVHVVRPPLSAASCRRADRKWLLPQAATNRILCKSGGSIWPKFANHEFIKRGEISTSSSLYLSKHLIPTDDETTTTSTTASFESADRASQTLVSSLTQWINWGVALLDCDKESIGSSTSDTSIGRVEVDYEKARDYLRSAFSPPTSPQELLQRIQSDYVDRNYLWTGQLDLIAFDENCTFTDPTLSFRGTEQFARNLQNLRPWIDLLVGPNQDYRSDLLSIELNESQQYVQTRWNMQGTLNGLPWKPRIDVVGRTKFWYKSRPDLNKVGDVASRLYYRVVFYDEEWEIQAYQALLQLVTPSW